MLVIGGIGLLVFIGGFFFARVQIKEAERKVVATQILGWRAAAESGDPNAQNNLGWMLAVSKDAAQRNGKEAVKWATKACVATGFTNWQHIDTLAAAFAEAGEFPQAVKYQQMALDQGKIRVGMPTPERDRLNLYQKGKPFRE